MPPAEGRPIAASIHPLVLLLFVGSGCAALIYEIVWLQMLQLVMGSSAVSLGVLLGTFMGGMCLGSLLLPAVIPARWHPLRVYAFLELGIGAIGIAVLHGMPKVGQIYAESVGHGMPGILLRASVAGICLIPPTLLMGATLPAVARWVRSTPRGVAWLGLFYGGNIAGAVFGCLLAGFYLLRLFDMATATYAAVAINTCIGLLALAIAAITPHVAPVTESQEIPNAPAANQWIVYLIIAVSGMTGLAAEVIWTRLLSLMLGATVYTFSIILAVFLLGLGIGSSAGAGLSRIVPSARTALGICQLLLALAIAWTAYQLAAVLPYAPVINSPVPAEIFETTLKRCMFAMLPAAILWGASFPLALAAAAQARTSDTGRLVGRLYAANTFGAIVGALVTSLFLIQLIGSQAAQQLLVLMSAAAALAAVMPALQSMSRGTAITALGGLAVIAGSAAWSVPRVPELLIAYGRYLPTRQLEVRDGRLQDHESDIIFAEEGMNASVAVSRTGRDVRSFHVSGRIEASSLPQDMRLQRMLGHIPALLHPRPRSVLVVGCGAGVTAGSFIVHPEVERIVICEIEPLIPQVVAKHFAAENHDVVRGIGGGSTVHEINGKRVEVIFDDARHFILTTSEKFDIITSDPIHPWIKGSATLYTEEYFRLCADRLNPGGIVTQWVPLYESTPAVVKSEIATFFNVFPRGTIWSNDIEGAGYDVILTAQAERMRIDVGALQERLRRTDHLPVLKSMHEVGFLTSGELLQTYAGQAADLAPWLADAEINRDRNLRLQYIAGMNLNNRLGEQIYNQILAYRRFPEQLFESTDESLLQPLRNALRARGTSTSPPPRD